MESLLQVGIISSMHGIRGEVKVFPTTDDANRFKELKDVLLDPGMEHIPLRIEDIKFFKQFVIIKFFGFDNINEIEKYKGKSIFVTRENAVCLKADEYYIADLIGMHVIDETGIEIGILNDVMETGANDVYVINMVDQKELLLPAIKQCILDVDIEKMIMKVHVLEGLL